MKVVVQNENVRKNIQAFQSAVQPLRFKLDTLGEDKRCEIEAYVHRKSGILSLKPPASNGREWKNVVLEVLLVPTANDEIFFCLYDDVEDRENFPWDEFDTEAVQTLSETFHLLNQTTREIFAFSSDPFLLIDGLCAIEISSGLQRISGKDLVHEAWHQVDRVGAEKILQKKSAGTFLFRKDEYVYILEKQLKDKFRLSLSCFTVSFVDKNQKVNDLTIVVKDNRWMFYDDDPNLEGITYPDIYLLLESAHDCFIIPLLETRLYSIEESPREKRRVG